MNEKPIRLAIAEMRADCNIEPDSATDLALRVEEITDIAEIERIANRLRTMNHVELADRALFRVAELSNP